jgi:hypothetical protein
MLSYTDKIRKSPRAAVGCREHGHRVPQGHRPMMNEPHFAKTPAEVPRSSGTATAASTWPTT